MEPYKRSIGLFGAISIGIGGMVGGGIFAVLGEAIFLTHGACVLAFLIAGMIALLTAYSYAKLSVAYPSKGGTVVFIDKAFGTDLLTGSFNVFLWLGYIVTMALYASAFGSYGLTFFPGWDQLVVKHFLVTLAILLPVVINLVNTWFVSESEGVIVFLKLVILLIVISAGIPRIDYSRLTPDTWADPMHIVAGGMWIFVAYEGFELIANAAEDIKDPEKNLPKAFYGSVAIVIILYALVALVTVGSVPESQIAQVKDYALAVAAKPSLGEFGFHLVAVSALLATFSALNATLYGNARLGFTLATMGELPEVLEKKAWKQPVSGVLIVAMLALLVANSFDIGSIAIMGSGGFLIIFTLVNLSAAKLSVKINASRAIAFAGSLACMSAFLILVYQTYQNHPSALWTLVLFLSVSCLFESVYPRKLNV